MGFEGCWIVDGADWAEDGFSAKRIQRMWVLGVSQRVDKGEEEASERRLRIRDGGRKDLEVEACAYWSYGPPVHVLVA